MATMQRPVLARYEVPACIRCGKAIAKGTRVEQWTTPHGKRRWVHEGCTPADGWGGANGHSPDDGVGSIDRSELESIVRAEVDSQLSTRALNGKPGVNGGGSLDLAAVDSRVNIRLNGFKSEVNQAMTGTLDQMAGKITEVVNANNHCVQTVNRLQKLCEDLDKARRVAIEIKRPNQETLKIEDHVHPAFADVMFHIEAGDNVMLVGPTGCGKTHLAMQLAKHLSRRFSMISCSVGLTESAIFGVREPAASGKGFEYHLSEYCLSYRDGGLHLWDEVDALDPNVFLSLNAAMANDVLSLPKNYKESQLKRHVMHVCLAAANTWGNGADRQYVGRNQLDGASIDRFVFIPMDYDELVERKLVQAKLGTDLGEQLVSGLHEYRNRARNAKLRRNISTRFILRAANWLAMGKEMEYVRHKLFESWTPEERSKVGA